MLRVLNTTLTVGEVLVFAAAAAVLMVAASIML
jgi:hypothetical protein